MKNAETFQVQESNGMKKACQNNSAFCILHSPFSSAFTLIELVVTMVIMAIIALVTIDYLVNAGRMYTLLLAQRQAGGSDAVAVVKRMRREARVLQANITNDSAEWAFSTRTGYTNSFQRSGNTVLLNNNVLAKNVQTFQLDYYDATNVLLTPPLIPTDQARVARVALELRVTNNWAASELKVNFFLREGFLK
jgi:prepilin-type N-terminal cleavage/methylation domain-containing protein